MSQSDPPPFSSCTVRGGSYLKGLCMLTILCSVAQAQDAGRPESSPNDPTVSSDPVFRLRLTDGSVQTGRIMELSSPDAVKISGESGRPIALRRVVSLTRESPPQPTPPLGALVLLPDGDRLRGIAGSITEGALTIRTGLTSGVPLTVPLKSVRGLVLAADSDSSSQQELARSVQRETKPSDIIWLANGDRLEGSLLSLSSDKVDFQPDTGPMSLPRASVLAIGFDPAPLQYPEPASPYIVVAFADGSRLSVHSARVQRGRLSAKTRFDADIDVPLGSVLGLVVRSEAVSYLTDREPDGAQYVGYLGEHPGSSRRNATWDGYPLMVGGREVECGLGTLPRTLLAYRLESRDKRFQATVALDDRAGELASVVYRVLVDGQEKWRSPDMGRRSQPVEVNVDVSGGKVLILATEFGERGDVQDSADWVDPRLIRE